MIQDLRFTRTFSRGAVGLVASFFALLIATPVLAQCSAPLSTNVAWGLADSIAGCPAGDSLTFSHSPLHPHPSRLRINVIYSDGLCTPHVGVPPESIWVTVSIVPGSGNLKVMDNAVKTFADDPTNAAGEARITIPSFAGCGKVRVYLYVSGVVQGNKIAVVRTVDTDANGRIDYQDANPCDVNYNGAGGDTTDSRLVTNHLDHWNRNLLHGTLVRRTSLCGTCPYEAPNTPPTIGASEISWSPEGKYVALSVFLPPNGDCTIHYVPANAADGNGLTQITFPGTGDHDYDPSWSPTNSEIAFDRGDTTIYSAALTAGYPLRLITHSSDGTTHPSGDFEPAISPNGKWVAFARRHPLAAFEIWKIPIEGTPGSAVAQQLTFTTTHDDQYPQWSPDGQFIIFERRENAAPFQRAVYRVPAAGGTPEVVLKTTVLQHSVIPSYSPDGRIVVAGHGDTSSTAPVTTRTQDASYTNQTDLAHAQLQYPAHGVTGYGDFIDGVPFAIPTPRMSPDGTRLALRAADPDSVLNHPQIWAARRNMSLPPRITSFGNSSITSDQVLLLLTVYKETTYSYDVSATDPEGDIITYEALWLEPWMTWSASLRRLTVIPGGTAGKSYNAVIRVRTSSGGTDQLVVSFSVCPCSGPGGFSYRSIEDTDLPLQYSLGPNPASDGFWLETSTAPGFEAHLWIYDLAGRVVADLRGPTDTRLHWGGHDRSGAPAPPGVYLYRLRKGENIVGSGRFVLLR